MTEKTPAPKMELRGMKRMRFQDACVLVGEKRAREIWGKRDTSHSEEAHVMAPKAADR